MAGRFFSSNDLRTFETFNKELVGDLRLSKDGIINQTIKLFKVSAEHTSTNLYGESTGGKIYKPGVKVNALIESEDFSFETDEFGPDSNQAVTFAFQRKNLIDINLKPEIGDVINWNYAYFEINSINENMLIGGDVDKNFDLVCTTHLTRLSRVNLTERQQ